MAAVGTLSGLMFAMVIIAQGSPASCSTPARTDMKRGPRYLFLFCLLLVASAPIAPGDGGGEDEDEGPQSVHELWHSWGLEPGSIIGLALTGGLYILGLGRTWHASGTGHGIRKWEAAAFAEVGSRCSSHWFRHFIPGARSYFPPT